MGGRPQGTQPVGDVSTRRWQADPVPLAIVVDWYASMVIVNDICTKATDFSEESTRSFTVLELNAKHNKNDSSHRLHGHEVLAG